MKRSAFLLSALLSCAIPAVAAAGGFLWLGSEFAGEGNIYRYNLSTNAVDQVQARPGGSPHWNNAATLGGAVYFGSPSGARLDRYDALTGAFQTTLTMTPAPAGLKEDGASFAGSLWLITYSGGALYRMSPLGAIESTFTVTSGLVGIEFKQGRPWATDYSPARFGTLERTSPTAFTFAALPWGAAPTGNPGALAHDAETGIMYMATSGSRLYRVDVSVDGDSAYASLVKDLTTVGYPAGGLIDGMGWVPLGATSAPAAPAGDAALRLGVPTPNPARDQVMFELSLARPMPVRVDILDAAGRRWRSWDLPGLGAGSHRIQWTFRGDDEREAPAGRYFVRVRSGEHEVTSPIVRVK